MHFLPFLSISHRWNKKKMMFTVFMLLSFYSRMTDIQSKSKQESSKSWLSVETKILFLGKGVLKL